MQSEIYFFVISLHQRHRYFCRDSTVAGEDVFIDDGVDGIFVAVSVVAQNVRQESVVMQAAVAQMSEADNLYAGETGFQGGGALTDKGGDLGDWDSDVVFDAGAELSLGGRNVFTQRPQIEAFLFRLRDDAVFLAVLIEELGKFFVERGIGNGIGQFEQDVPVCIGRLFEMTELKTMLKRSG